jgi:hypothetical protein
MGTPITHTRNRSQHYHPFNPSANRTTTADSATYRCESLASDQMPMLQVPMPWLDLQENSKQFPTCGWQVSGDGTRWSRPHALGNGGTLPNLIARVSGGLEHRWIRWASPDDVHSFRPDREEKARER